MRCPSGPEVGMELMEMKHDFWAIRESCENNSIAISICAACCCITFVFAFPAVLRVGKFYRYLVIATKLLVCCQDWFVLHVQRENIVQVSALLIFSILADAVFVALSLSVYPLSTFQGCHFQPRCPIAFLISYKSQPLLCWRANPIWSSSLPSSPLQLQIISPHASLLQPVCQSSSSIPLLSLRWWVGGFLVLLKRDWDWQDDDVEEVGSKMKIGALTAVSHQGSGRDVAHEWRRRSNSRHSFTLVTWICSPSYFGFIYRPSSPPLAPLSSEDCEHEGRNSENPAPSHRCLWTVRHVFILSWPVRSSDNDRAIFRHSKDSAWFLFNESRMNIVGHFLRVCRVKYMLTRAMRFA